MLRMFWVIMGEGCGVEGDFGGLELEWDRNGVNPADIGFSNVNHTDNWRL